MMFFVKVTTAGLLVAQEKLTTKTVTINGIEHEFNVQGSGKLGFIACPEPERFGLEKGDELPFKISDVPVRIKGTDTVIPNLYWATPE